MPSRKVILAPWDSWKTSPYQNFSRATEISTIYLSRRARNDAWKWVFRDPAGQRCFDKISSLTELGCGIQIEKKTKEQNHLLQDWVKKTIKKFNFIDSKWKNINF